MKAYPKYSLDDLRQRLKDLEHSFTYDANQYAFHICKTLNQWSEFGKGLEELVAKAKRLKML